MINVNIKKRVIKDDFFEKQSSAAGTGGGSSSTNTHLWSGENTVLDPVVGRQSLNVLESGTGSTQIRQNSLIDDRYVGVANVQTITGEKTYTLNVNIPTAIFDSHAINKGYANANYGQLTSANIWTENNIYNKNVDVKNILTSNQINVSSGTTLTLLNNDNHTLKVDGILSAKNNVNSQNLSIGSTDFSGTGWRITNEGNANVNNLIVRGAARFRELIIDQLSVVGGSQLLSTARGKVRVVYPSSSSLLLEDPDNVGVSGFAVNDIIWIKSVKKDKTNIKDIKARVTTVSGMVIWLAWDITGHSGSINDIVTGDVVVQRGNINTATRQNLIYTTSTDTDSPVMKYMTNINTIAAFDNIANIKVVTGNLQNVTNAEGMGIYGSNAYFTGKLIVGDLTKTNNYLAYENENLDIKTKKFQLESILDNAGIEIDSTSQSVKLFREVNNAKFPSVEINANANIPSITEPHTFSATTAFVASVYENSNQRYYTNDVLNFNTELPLVSKVIVTRSTFPTGTEYTILVEGYKDGNYRTLNTLSDVYKGENLARHTHYLSTSVIGLTEVRVSIIFKNVTNIATAQAGLTNVEMKQYNPKVVLNKNGLFMAVSPEIVQTLNNAGSGGGSGGGGGTYVHPTGFVNQPTTALTNAAVISQISVNDEGHVTGITSRNLTAANISAAPSTHVGATGNAHGNATTAVAGFMAAADKTKLDGIAAGAQVNVPTNLTATHGTTSVTVTSSTGSDAGINIATTSNAGVMSAADKTKLDAINQALSTTSNVTFNQVTASFVGNLSGHASTAGTAASTDFASTAGSATYADNAGTSSTAATLATARNINGTSFNGSSAITTANWGTARNLTIGNTAKSVNGSANVAWTLAEIGAAATSQAFFLGTTAIAINRPSASGHDIDGIGTLNATSLTASANVNALRLGVSSTEGTSGRGISLYGGATTGMPTYGLSFAQTGTFGNHGGVTGDWATYFTTNDSGNLRGWIFKRGTTNVASINGNGVLTVASNITAGGSVTATNFVLGSDRKLKTKIEDIKTYDACVRYVEYERKDDGENRKRYGVIAQEIENIYPDLVWTNEEGMKAVDYTSLMIKEIAYLKKKIIELENKIK
jgi:hypothetical protein